MKQVSRPLKWLSTAKMVNLAPVSGNSTKMRIEIAQKKIGQGLPPAKELKELASTGTTHPHNAAGRPG